MVHFRTLLKTFVSTLIVLIILECWFRAYMKLFNQDLAQKVAHIIYQNGTWQCPICETSTACPLIQETSSPATQLMTGLLETLKTIEIKIDSLASQQNTTSTILPNTAPTTTGDIKASEAIIEDLQKRIETLEKKSP